MRLLFNRSRIDDGILSGVVSDWVGYTSGALHVCNLTTGGAHSTEISSSIALSSLHAFGSDLCPVPYSCFFCGENA